MNILVYANDGTHAEKQKNRDCRLPVVCSEDLDTGLSFNGLSIVDPFAETA